MDLRRQNAADPRWGLLVNKPSLLELEVEELLEGAGAAAVFTVWGIVLPAVGNDPLQVSYEELPGDVVATAQPFCHGLQVWVKGEKGHAFKKQRGAAGAARRDVFLTQDSQEQTRDTVGGVKAEGSSPMGKRITS